MSNGDLLSPPSQLSSCRFRGCLSPGSRSRIALSPPYRPVVNSTLTVLLTFLCCISGFNPSLYSLNCKQPRFWEYMIRDAEVNSPIHYRRQMSELEWMTLVKCGFGMYERSFVLLCSSCSVNYYDNRELSANCDCCVQSRGTGNSSEHRCICHTQVSAVITAVSGMMLVLLWVFTHCYT